MKSSFTFLSLNQLAMKLALLVSCFCISALWNSNVCSQESAISRPLRPPYAVVIDTYKRNDAKQMEQQRMYQRFLSPEMAGDKTEDEIATQTYSRYWPKEVDFTAVSGCAYCLDDKGLNAPIYLRTAPDDYAYRFLIEQSLAAQKVPGQTTDFGYYTKLGATSWEEPRTVTRPRQKIDEDGNIVKYMQTVEFLSRVSTEPGYIGYKNGVVLYGSDYVPRAPFKAISEFAAKGQGHDWAIFIRPDAMPLAQRKKNLQTFTYGVGTQSQIRDGEQDTTYDFRSSRLKAWADLVRAFWIEVDSVDWTISEATPDKPYRTRMEVVARPGSDLAKQFASLRAARPPAISSKGALARLYMAFTVPESYRGVFVPLVKHSSLADTSLGFAIKEFLAEGRCRCRANLLLNEDSQLVLQGIIATTMESLPAKSLASDFGRSDEQLTTIPLVFRIGDWQQAVIINAEIVNRNLCFSVASNERVSKRPAAQDAPDTVEDSTTLVGVHIDLRQFSELESDHSARELLSNLEWLVRLLAPKPGKNERRIAHPFQSLTHHISAEGDWTLEFTIKLQGSNRLVMDAQIGSDLITLWRCRKIVDGLLMLQ